MNTSRTRSGTEPATAPSASAPAAPAVTGPRPFDGYPYLVTRIGRTALRHLAVVPAAWPRDRLIDLARRQADANQLETCVCLGPADAVYVVPGGEPQGATHIPTGYPVVDRLVLADSIPESPELARRHSALLAYAGSVKGAGHIVGDGLEGGRSAIDEDIVRLSGRGDGGLPPGLRPCAACGQPHGQYLSLRGLDWDERTPQVVDVHCRCDNHNRCAGCGEPLTDQRLSAYYWDEDRTGVWYVAAYCGLSHRCA